MNKNKIIEMILNNKKYTQDEKEVITGIQEAMIEIEVARNSFNNVSDKNLIDVCMHKEDEAKSKYIFYLSQAKSKNIKVVGDTLIEELEYSSKW